MQYLLPAERRGVVCLVPLTERSGVDGNDGVLDESLGSHELVVAGVVHGVDDTRLASDRLRSPRKVAGVQPEIADAGVALLLCQTHSCPRRLNDTSDNRIKTDSHLRALLLMLPPRTRTR